MKSKYILMALAMSLQMNAYSQAIPSPSQILTKLESPAVSPTLSAEQRAAKMPALALIPSDSSICISVQGLSNTVKDIMEHPMMKGMLGNNGDLISAWPMSVKDITFAVGAGADKMIDAALLLFQSISQRSSHADLMMIADLVHINANEGDASAARNPQDYEVIFSGILKFLKADQVAPCLLIASLEDSTVPMVKALVGQWMQKELPKPNFSNEGMTPHKGKYAGLDFEGVKVNGKALALSETFQAALKKHASPQDIESILGEVVKHELYVLYAYQGNKLIVSISRDPASQIKVAATPKDSILASGKLAFTDKVNQTSMILGYGEAAIYASFLKYQEADMAGSLKGYENALKTMDLGDISGVLASFNAIKADYESMSKLTKVNHPVTALLWGDKGLQAEFIAGDDGTLSPETAVKLVSFADRPENILFIGGSSSATHTARMLSRSENIVSAGWQVLQRMAPILAQKNPQNMDVLQQFAQSVAFIQESKPDLLQLWSSCKLAMSGMGNGTSFIMDDKGTLPKITELSPELSKLRIPRAAMALDVTNRQKISTAWDSIMVISEKLIKSINPEVQVEMIKPQNAVNEGITSYCYPGPFFTPNFKPSLSISDKAWAIGSSPNLTLSVVKTMALPHTGSLTGMVFAFNLDPVVAMLKTNLELLTPMGITPSEQMRSLIFPVLEKVQGIYATMTTDGKTIRCRFSLQVK